MTKLILLILKLLFILNQFYLAKCDLKLVAEFFRHGARQTIYDYWNAEIFPDWGEFYFFLFIIIILQFSFRLTSVGMR